MAWGSRSFSGSTSNFLSTGSAVQTTLPLTLACWVNMANLTTAMDPISISNTSVDGQWWRIDIAASTGLVSADQNASGGFHNTGSAGTVSTGVWNQITATFTSSTIACYLNGGAPASVGSVAGPTGLNNTFIALLNHGGTLTGAGSGQVAQVAIWNVVLTTTEISALAQGAVPSTIRPASLVAYWPLNGLVLPEPDLSGKANNMAQTGTVTTAFGAPLAPFTPRWPQFIPAAAAGFKPAWALGKNIVVEGVAT